MRNLRFAVVGGFNATPTWRDDITHLIGLPHITIDQTKPALILQIQIIVMLIHHLSLMIKDNGFAIRSAGKVTQGVFGYSMQSDRQ